MIFFKTATVNELSDLETLVNSAYRGDYSKKGWTTEADILDGQRTDRDSLEAIINTPQNQIELAYLKDTSKLIGCVHLKLENPDILYFGMLTIEPTYQSKGLGKILLNHVDEIARARHCRKIRILVLPLRKELIAYYERRGFIKTGTIEPFPADPKFGLPKVSDLSLHEFVKVLGPAK